ncbi:MAG TPA: hypothetical protein VNJ07_01270 [Chitinophagales bacterium]|nr:hypothetical protein [Chitinophagales bacterium]
MTAKKIFNQISRYISEHFRGSFLYETKTTKDAHGNIFYEVELSQDDVIHHLRFNKEGKLVSKEVEEAFPEERDS